MKRNYRGKSHSEMRRIIDGAILAAKEAESYVAESYKPGGPIGWLFGVRTFE